MPYGQNERQNILQQTSMRHQYVALKNRLVRCNANSKKKNGVPQQKKGFLGRNSKNIPGSQVLFRSQNQFYRAIKLEKKLQLTKKASRRISKTYYDILTQRTHQTHQIYHIHQIHTKHHIHQNRNRFTRSTILSRIVIDSPESPYSPHKI